MVRSVDSLDETAGQSVHDGYDGDGVVNPAVITVG